MTPFGERLRDLRHRKGVTQKQMAREIGVSPAYLSALEHGHRGVPSWTLLQRIIGYFNIIWDESDDLMRVANSSHPRVVVDTAGLSPNATALANLLGSVIGDFSDTQIDALLDMVSAFARSTHQKD